MVLTETKRINYWSQIAVLLGLVGFGIILSGLITVFLGGKALGTTTLTGPARIEAMQAALFKPENTTYAQIAQVLGTFFIMFVPSVAFILIFYKKFLWAGFSRHFNGLQILIGFFIILTANYFASPFADITKSILAHFPAINALAKNAEDMYGDAIAAMSNLKGGGQFLLAVFIIAFFPAMFEELLFRGVLQNVLTRWTKKPVIALVITSILFSLIHASYYLFISRFVLGLALGLLFYQTKNIWINIFAHFMNNLLALAALFYNNMYKKLASTTSDLEPKLPVWSLLITFAILVGLFILLENVSKENKNRIALNENMLLSNEPLIAQQS
jgi:hypothetical protein